jgi:acetyl/propionyl-CoA carboxylase alpha subunit
MFKSVLIANRGEIAVRIAKTLRKMGIRSVVVASIPDRRSLAVRTADAWVLLEGYSAAESYLDIDAVIAAAKAEGCEAIHPGYGFLSERADFAERCAAEGIVFIGPPPAVLRGMGDKAAARQLAIANGVPVVPGWDGADDDATLVREAARIGFPVMLKARGGGGGRGMREVFAPEELPEAIESARRVALSAFGDGGLLLEKLVTNAHHVEVQVLADKFGNVIHLGERDCSVQRRHQKLIEETPSPVVDQPLRDRLTGYALTLARAINYENAGTFEFLVSIHDSRFTIHDSTPVEADVFFLEVNPRLQVEHPVTEMVTGLDLVELQLRIAAGEALPLKQEDVKFEGHAIEFRINAEDPWDGFKPSSGRVKVTSQRNDFRFDSGFAEGDEVPPQYDSLVAKAVIHRPSRDEVVNAAEFILDFDMFHGPRSNIGLLSSVASSVEFRSGSFGIERLEETLPTLLVASSTHDSRWVAAGICHVGSHNWEEGDRSGTGVAAVFLDDGMRVRRVEVSLHTGNTVRDRGLAWLDGSKVPTEFRFVRDFSRFDIAVDGWSIPAWYELMGRDQWQAVRAERLFYVVPPPPLPRRARAAAEGVTAVTAPLAGTIAMVRVKEGDNVNEGETLLTLEAMKMEHRVTAPNDGTVKAVNVRDRDVVREGDVLVELA